MNPDKPVIHTIGFTRKNAEKFFIAAQHEAAHAVMRRLCGLKATRLTVDGEGGGFCEGTDEPIRIYHDLLVTLAGMAWETKCRFTEVDWENTRHTFVDAGRAWQLVTDCPLLRIRTTKTHESILEEPASALHHWFALAGDMLRPHRRVIREMGEKLQLQGLLSALEVEELLRGTTASACDPFVLPPGVVIV